MSKYRYKTSPEFEVDFKKLRKNFELVERLKKKIKTVSENPYHYKPLRNILKGKRRTHIGSFVLIFEIIEDENLIVFHRLQHHDEAYK
jgi:YafQ family addiction module toxin component